MDPTHNQSLEALDRARVMHPNTDLRAFAAGELGDPTIVTGADGLRIRDRKGNEWIDGFASLWCVNIGYGRAEIAETLREQALAMAYYHGHAGHSPPLIVTEADVEEMIARMKRAVDREVAALAAEGAWRPTGS